MSRGKIIGPIVVNETTNSQRYRRFLLEPFLNQLDDVALTNDYFQQDSVIAARTRINYLEEFFRDRLISVGPWSSRSPDLKRLHFFFLHLKMKC
jgi:hypothetical protein